MYVQEYGPSCPQPNTGRTYISYLDSVRMLRTEPPEQRTTVYHALINGYIASARDRGFEHAHIWVAPPQAGDEYIFHCHPEDAKHGTRMMSMGKLREWCASHIPSACSPPSRLHPNLQFAACLTLTPIFYLHRYVHMLEAALKDGIVSAFDDIQEHVAHLASIRDFPLFEGDFFPDHLKVMLAPPAPSRGGGGASLSLIHI